VHQLRWRKAWLRDSAELLEWKRNAVMRDPKTGRFPARPSGARVPLCPAASSTQYNRGPAKKRTKESLSGSKEAPK
jgi:hypothetical protein